ncbi:hypothetical protein C7S18_17835 [Ahniella affigens]|uniref:Uncharacterized protein n=1 Tax=Ahniella affigens TaxID=2021234 RepID=A0A2P1PVP5_9GAMM|nr:hypothetical protein [Ahniella affigens]AVP98925.1 hypothetical protein C7S18_17835 [Ahniella affigens]
MINVVNTDMIGLTSGPVLTGYSCTGFDGDLPLEVDPDRTNQSCIALKANLGHFRELNDALVVGQMVDFGVMVSVNGNPFYFDPQATNDPR